MAIDSEPVITKCTVCGGAFDPLMSAECNWCNRPFHLNQRNDVEAKDCGEVWIDEQYLALQFACNDCLAGDSGSAGTTDDRPRPKVEVVRPRRYKRRA